MWRLDDPVPGGPFSGPQKPDYLLCRKTVRVHCGWQKVCDGVVLFSRVFNNGRSDEIPIENSAHVI